MYECVPGGIAIPKSLTNGTSLFSCTSSLMPAPGFGPIMYSYCSMFIRSRRPRSAPGTWCRHDMETLSPLFGLCKGNPPITSTFPSQWPGMWICGVFFDVSLNKLLNKRPSCRCIETHNAQITSLWYGLSIPRISHKRVITFELHPNDI